MVLYAASHYWSKIMLQISKLTDYATVIMSYLALDSKKIVSATTVARDIHLAVPTVSKILKMLTAATLVQSFRGAGGGYQLARSTQKISVAEVVSAIEGQLAMTECCAAKHACAIHSLCAIKDNWKIINNIILNALASVTLHDMTHSLTGHTVALRGIPIKIEKIEKLEDIK